MALKWFILDNLSPLKHYNLAMGSIWDSISLLNRESLKLSFGKPINWHLHVPTPFMTLKRIINITKSSNIKSRNVKIKHLFVLCSIVLTPDWSADFLWIRWLSFYIKFHLPDLVAIFICQFKCVLYKFKKIN